MALHWGTAAALLGLFVPFFGPLLATGVVLTALSSARGTINKSDD
jgi:hypothetical protein